MQAVNYPKTEAVVFGMPAATAAAATIQVGSNSVAVKPQFKYVGSTVQADGGQDRELQRRLCSAGQVFRSLKANLFSSRWVGLGAKLKSPGAAAAHVRHSGVLGPHRGTGGTTGDLPQWLPKADDGPPPRPRWPLHG